MSPARAAWCHSCHRLAATGAAAAAAAGFQPGDSGIRRGVPASAAGRSMGPGHSAQGPGPTRGWNSPAQQPAGQQLWGGGSSTLASCPGGGCDGGCSRAAGEDLPKEVVRHGHPSGPLEPIRGADREPRGFEGGGNGPFPSICFSPLSLVLSQS